MHCFMCTITVQRERCVFISGVIINMFRRLFTLFLSTEIFHAHSMEFINNDSMISIPPLDPPNTAGSSPHPATHIILINVSCQINAEITLTLVI